MKWMKQISVWMLAASALMVGCNDDDNANEPMGGNLPPVKTQQVFAREYPNAQNVRWDKKHGYDVAYFNYAATRVATEQNSAWYTQQSERCYANHDLSWAELQQEAPAVAQAWEQSTYKAEGYELDDITKKVMKDDSMTQYKLEVELGDVEYDLIYAADGTLLSEKLDIDTEDEDEEDEPAPWEILDFVANNLPEAQILESELEDEDGEHYYEVEIAFVRDNEKIEADMIFSVDGKLLGIIEEIEDEQVDQLPQAVVDQLAELAKSGELDDISLFYSTIEAFRNGEPDYYIVEIEMENQEGEEQDVVVRLNKDGEVIAQ